ncbi:serine--tRNA ligase, mitochondrial-like isoform X2 [Apostichopus japonicus]|uniref:serine--tRNA ligase, mitochondrial-like isoform X2 n=1 Tax=Stichopus japonicus TaxID=307972 RepID=UPI003AB39C31
MKIRVTPLMRILQGGCSLCRQSSTVTSTSGEDRSSSMDRKNIFKSVKPDVDMNHILNNTDAIARNIQQRKGDADVHKVVTLWKELKQLKEKLQSSGGVGVSKDSLTAQVLETEQLLLEQVCALPNDTHPDTPMNESDEPRLVEEIGVKRKFDFPIKDHAQLGENLNIIRTKHLGHITGHRSYYLRGAGAQLERALVKYTLERLVKRHNFKLISVPDIVKANVFEGCGMRTEGLHTQVYKLNPAYHPGNLCLAGTAEVGLAGYLMNRTFHVDELPLRLAAVSRCFRAETTHSSEARGLFRVHQFTKVEMFGVTSGESSNESDDFFKEIVAIQRNLFADLGLHFQILDMPAHDLGSPAYRKYDVEAWMPGRDSYGEISSASNCTDYQSRRLRIKYRTDGNSDSVYAHTLNGTACAVPRLIIAILENYQDKDGSVRIPDVLQPYMFGQKVITRPVRGHLHHTRL